MLLRLGDKLPLVEPFFAEKQDQNHITLVYIFDCQITANDDSFSSYEQQLDWVVQNSVSTFLAFKVNWT
jgi:hypothetical protein